MVQIRRDDSRLRSYIHLRGGNLGLFSVFLDLSSGVYSSESIKEGKLMTKKMKWKVFIAIALVVLLVAGCAPAAVEQQEEEEPVEEEVLEVEEEEPTPVAVQDPVGAEEEDLATIRIWNWEPDSPLFGKFLEDNPEYTQVLAEITAADATRLLTAIAAGAPPDVIFLGKRDAFLLAFQGALRTLDEFILTEGENPFEQFHTGVRDMGMIYGKRYMFPWNLDFAVLFYNKELFREAELNPDMPPKTWAELTDHATKLTVFGEDGMVTQQGLAHNRDRIIYGAFARQGGNWLTMDGFQGRGTSERLRTALTTYFGFDNVFGADDKVPADLHFNKGNVAMYFGSWMLSQPAADLGFEWGVGTVPGPDANSPFTAVYAEKALVLPVNSRNPLGGYRLAEWFATNGAYEDASAQAAEEGVNFRGRILAHTGAQERMNELMLNSNPQILNAYNQTVALFAEYARFATVTPVADLYGVLLPLLERVDKGELTIEDATTEFNNTFNTSSVAWLREQLAMGHFDIAD